MTNNFWYKDPWNGGLKEFTTLKAAKEAARSEYGTSIYITNKKTGKTYITPASGYTPN